MHDAAAQRIALRFASLAPESRRLAYEHMRRSGVEPLQLPVLPRQHGSRAVLSYAQARQWFLWNLDPSSTAYHICSGLRIRGSLDVEVLQKSFASLIERHESLRTIIRRLPDGLAEPVVMASCPIEIRFVDLSAEPAESRERRAMEEAQRIADTAFDLTTGPLLRVAVLRFAPEEHALVVVLHHIVADGWSMQVIVDEFAELYRAQVEGRQANLQDLPIQYADYAVWQRNWFEAGEQERQLAFWKAELGDEHPLLLLPTDRPRSTNGKYLAAHYSFDLPAALAEGLRDRAREYRATLFMVLLAGFQALLHRYTGLAEIRVGTTNANRNRPEIQAVVGFFVNTQVLQTRIDGCMTLSVLLERVREAVIGAQEHQDLPFEKLVEALNPERSFSYSPLFQVMMDHQRLDYRALAQLPELTLQGFGLGAQGAQFELTLNTAEKADGGISVSFTYAQELFDRTTIERMAGHYAAVLRAIEEKPIQPLSEAALLSEAELAQLRQWGLKVQPHESTEPVTRLIEKQVKSHPQALALVLGKDELSYGELNARANRLAHRLIAAGVRPEERVGIALERSIEMVVSILAVLKAGGTYVPLDPQYPSERLSYMLRDSGIGLVLTQSAVLAEMPSLDGMAALNLDGLDLDSEPDTDPNVQVHSYNLAYVIYTSGSTGKPRGVAIPHHALADHNQVAIEYFGLTPADRMLQFSTSNFDAFVEQLFPPLCAGAAVVLRGKTLWDSATFYREVHARRISIADLPTAYWFMLTQDFRTAGPRDYGVLRQIQATGEAMPAEGIRNWCDAGLTGVKLLNTYGPTEATVTATAFDCSDYIDGQREVPAQIPIGVPLRGRNMYVLDQDLSLVPPGVEGELCIGGSLLAQGYVGRGGFTAERFIANPFAEKGGRLYRTGDKVRWSADGQLAYLGRIDNQVKIRGFRVEPGDIETHLLSNHAVREAAVIAYDSQTGTRLVAYVCPQPGGQITADSLRAQLRESVPDHMVPAQFVLLEKLPLSVNGKIDRRALPPPPTCEAEDGYTVPRDEWEENLAEIWRRALGLNRVGRHDHFFELGGHSLIATQVIARVENAFHIEIPLRVLFDAPRLAQFAEQVRARTTHSRVSRKPLVRVNRNRPLPLSYAQQRLWFLWNLEPGSAAYNVPAAVRLEGPLDLPALQKSFDALIRRHEVLRTTFHDADGGAVQRIENAGVVAIETTDLTPLPHAQRVTRARAVVEEQSLIPFDLENGPLLRVSVVRLDTQDHLLFVTMHHIISDDGSMRIVVRELMQLYEAYSSGRDPQLADPPIQYVDFAVWQRDWLEVGELQRQLAYWKAELNDGAEVLELPADRPRQDVMSSRGASHRTMINASIVSRLKGVARENNVTLFTLLLAACSIVLKYRSGQSTFLIGTNVENRPRSELEPLVGFFVNQLALRIRFDGLLRAGDLLARLQAIVLGALDHQDLPFDRLVEALQPQRRSGRSPFFTVKMIYQAGGDSFGSLPGMQLREFAFERAAVELDLIMGFSAVGDALRVSIDYSTELFEPASIACIAEQTVAVLQCLAAEPDASLERLDEAAAKVQLMRHSASKVQRNAQMQQIKDVRRRRLPAAHALVSYHPRLQDESLPMLCTPVAEGLSLSAWARDHREEIGRTVDRHGAILFRGFEVRDAAEFNACIEGICGEALEYRFRSSPRTQVDPALRIYTSTDYPPSEKILPHNENSYASEFPSRLLFYCHTPASSGGETPIGDTRDVLRNIRPEVQETFLRKKVMYVRNFGDGLGLPWQTVFQTTEPEQVERYCAAAGIEVEWRTKKRLRTRRIGPAIIRHPRTGEPSWFNHAAFFNALALPECARASLLAEYALDELPQNTFYGDGTLIEPEVIAHLQKAYRDAMIEFSWQQGDVLLIDNLVTAHARNEFTGQRRILVGMAGVGLAAELEVDAGHEP